MILRRILWAAIILAAAILYLFDNQTITLAVLVICAAAPLCSGLLLLLHPGHAGLQLCRDGDTITLYLKNPGRLPLAGLQFDLHISNLRTGQDETRHLETSLAQTKPSGLPLPVSLEHAGRYEISVQTRSGTDSFRLFRRKMAGQAELALTIYPKESPLHMTMLGSAAAMLDSDRYSEKKRGNDPGEVRSIYEYQPGDPVKNIHWKLSEKVDKLLVKELGMPVSDPILVLLGSCKGYDSSDPDIASSKKAAEAAATASDTVASVFASVLRSLQEEELNCSAGWQNAGSGDFRLQKIAGEEDLRSAAEDYLTVPAEWSGDITSLWDDLGQERFAHLLIVSDERPMGIENITGGGQITLLQYGYSGSHFDDGGVSVIGFDETDWRQALAEIEV